MPAKPKYDYAALEKAYVEGIQASNGEIIYPNYPELANAFGVKLQSIRKYGSRNSWLQKRANFQAQVEAREHARSATKRATQADLFKEDIFLIAKTGAFILSSAMKVDVLRAQEAIKYNERIIQENKMRPAEQQIELRKVDLDLPRLDIIARINDKLLRSGYGALGIVPGRGQDGPDGSGLEPEEENYVDEILRNMPRQDLQKIKNLFNQAARTPVKAKR